MANAGSYRVESVTCPRCNERIAVRKRLDGSSIHAARTRALAAHVNEKHRTVIVGTTSPVECEINGSPSSSVSSSLEK